MIRLRGWLAAAVLLAAAATFPMGASAQKAKKPKGTAPTPGGTATPVSHMRIKKDFRVELIYNVPTTQGSWVSLTDGPKGTLFASDQYGKLYRVTPPGAAGGETKVDVIAADLGEAQGLLWVKDSLYVVVNRGGKFASGLYRVRASKGDDNLDTVEKLREIPGSSEHGPHAVILGPDRKSLYVVAGNHTPLISTDTTTVPRLWGEDFVLPRQWDASGHARGILAPGGWIARTDLDGKKWDLVSMGYRNQYDIAFNREGELFTFDSDMEWDMNTPWYRPIRVCHAVDGSEFGWRSGTGVYPNHYPDNLPPVVDVGQGSPTGVGFGYGAKFPAKYQDALFLCDWSYGKLYAAHLKADGASYTAEVEEFITGTPLPLTDLVVNPSDGALYFTTGGRRVTSALYRITYVGSESTAPSKGDPAAGAELRALRKSLEARYSQPGPESLDLAWKHLGHSDRFVRWAARTILEFNPPETWREKALSEKDLGKSLAGLLALIRTGKKDDRALQSKVLDKLLAVDATGFDDAKFLEWTRLIQLAFVRLGDATPEQRTAAASKLEPFYPSVERSRNSELCKLLVYLQSRVVVDRTLRLLAVAPTQEEQMDYALSLRVSAGNDAMGWTRASREKYFGWFARAAGYRGGHSFVGFVNNIKTEAVATLSDADKKALKPIIDASPKVENPWVNAKPRPFVHKYAVGDLLPTVEKGMTGRDFARGRQVFGEAKCFNCHRFANEGGAFGPDLTALAGRFNAKDLLESILEPSKTISDQYAAVTVTTSDGKLVTGRIINLNGDNLMVNTDMMNPDKLQPVNRLAVESMVPSKISMMPENLLDTYTQAEILDLMAYLLSRGDSRHAMFRKE